MAAWKLGPGARDRQRGRDQARPTTSLSLLRIAELGAEAGLPDGVLNVVTGPRRRPSARRSAAIPTSTASRSPARPRSAGGFLTLRAPRRTSSGSLLELGGKSPQVVMADARGPRPTSPRTLAIAIFWNMGENCSAGSRLLVHRRVKDELLERLVARVEPRLDRRRPARPGDADRRADLAGPHGEGPRLHRRRAAAEGARVVAGGGADPRGQRRLVRPADDLRRRRRNDMRIAREEIFGPVLSVIEFETEDEAIAHRQRHAVRPGGLALHART